MSDQSDEKKDSAKNLTIQEKFELFRKSASQEPSAPHMSHEPFRLDFIFDTERNVLIIQGDENGLKLFGESVLSLAHPSGSAGQHQHFDESRVSSSNIEEVIVQRVNTDNDEGILHP